MTAQERREAAGRIVILAHELMMDLATDSTLNWWALAAARDLWRLSLKLERVLPK